MYIGIEKFQSDWNRFSERLSLLQSVLAQANAAKKFSLFGFQGT